MFESKPPAFNGAPATLDVTFSSASLTFVSLVPYFPGSVPSVQNVIELHFQEISRPGKRVLFLKKKLHIDCSHSFPTLKLTVRFIIFNIFFLRLCPKSRETFMRSKMEYLLWLCATVWERMTVFTMSFSSMTK